MERIQDVVREVMKSIEKRYDSREDQKLNSRHDAHFQLLSNSLEGKYLKDCLKTLNQVKGYSAYLLSASELTGFVKIWIESNPKDIHALFVKPDGHARKLENKLVLPHINNGKCSQSWHYETVYDTAGRLRCAQVSRHPISRKKDFCYKIISEFGMNLSLELILNRLDESSKLEQERTYDRLKMIFPFDSHTLALYVKKWYDQKPDNPIFFEKKW